MISNGMPIKALFCCAAFCSGMVIAGAAFAERTTETAQDWTASADEVNTGEDLRKTCSATTSFTDAAGIAWTATLSISDGDVMPPDGYPGFEISVTAGDFPDGEGVPAVFTIDDIKVEATVNGGGSAVDGSQWMMNNTIEASQALFRAMAKGAELAFTLDGKPVVTMPIRGFADAYRRLGNWCGYPTSDVVG